MTKKEIDEKVEEAFRRWFNEKFDTSGVSASQLKIYRDCFKRGCMFGVIMLNNKNKKKGLKTNEKLE